VPASPASAPPCIGAAALQAVSLSEMCETIGKREAVWRACLRHRSWKGGRTCQRMCHSSARSTLPRVKPPHTRSQE
jgi:hypothetical protein